MSWTHNPIAEMRGPDFLVFYATVILGTLALCWWRLWKADPTRSMRAPAIPPELDPYEVAYLRGGPNEVLRLVILSLIQRGYLRPDKPEAGDQIEKHPDHPDARYLSKLEKKVFDGFDFAKTAPLIFASESLQRSAEAACQSYEEHLQSQSLLLPEDIRVTKQSTFVWGLAIMLGLGGYKLCVALAKGRHNVGFLILMGLFSLVVLGLMSGTILRRMSSRGKAYLETLTFTFDKLKQRISQPRSTEGALSEDLLLLLAGVFGIGVLSGTAYAFYPKMFQKAAVDSGGSTWASSSSCGSASSCGSGGGGGCGCGGCGGGD